MRDDSLDDMCGDCPLADTLACLNCPRIPEDDDV